jgi:hypothetical protein
MLALLLFGPARAQSDFQRVSSLERRMSAVENRRLPSPEQGLVLVLYGVVCALWAQNSGRNAWLWFGFGLIGALVAAFAVLYLNAQERRARVPLPGPG